MFSRFDKIPAYDGRTDGRTDVKPIAITCFSIADARKNTRKNEHYENLRNAWLSKIKWPITGRRFVLYGNVRLWCQPGHVVVVSDHQLSQQQQQQHDEEECSSGRVDVILDGTVCQ